MTTEQLANGLLQPNRYPQTPLTPGALRKRRAWRP
jgi:hypothetical protein